MDKEEGRDSVNACTHAADGRPSYWLDACEDVSCDDYFVDFEPATITSIPEPESHSHGGCHVTCFFGGVDRTVDSIKNGDSDLLTHTTTNPSRNPLQNSCSSAQQALVQDKHSVSRPAIVNCNGKRSSVYSNGFKNDETDNGKMHHEFYDSAQRHDKKIRGRDPKKERRIWERAPGRKRQHGWDDPEADGQVREKLRRRERYSTGSWKERDHREARGYWEREKETNELVFRVGSWESCRNRDEKVNIQKSNKCTGSSEEKKGDEPKEKLPEEQARQYQLDVLEQAKKRNTIAFLETGAGKTLIAVLLMKSVSTELQKQNKKMLAVFLVPKVPLVYQQAEVIRERTGYQVGHYCGEMGQDFWDARRWQREFESKQVLVMTAQILLNILRHSIVKMEAINLLILDECHHAVKKHPYSLVMSEFYHTTPKEKRPSVFGMTASPVNLKGVSSQVDCALKIRNLESKLDAVVCTIKDRAELEKHVPMPSEVVVEYDKAASLWSLHEQIKQMEQMVEEAARSSSRRSKWQFMGARDAGAKEELRQVYGVSERTESDGAANLIQKLRAINYALGELGQWCAYKVAQAFLTALQNDERANYQLDVKFQESYLQKVVSLLQCHLSEGAFLESNIGGRDTDSSSADAEGNGSDELEEGELTNSHVVSGGEHVDVIIGAAVADGKVTPKVQSLIKILLKYQHTEDFRAIIFVERVVAALVLPKVFAELPSLSFVKSASLIGHNNSQEMRTSQMQDTIARFRDGRVTVLVATSVAEEGLDIRQCNVVIRFDLAKTVLAYIQSRGRARKPGSDYILMVERGNLSHTAFLRNARNSEETLRKEAIERTDISHLKDSGVNSGESIVGTVYQVESTGAVVSLNSAVGLIHFYCSQLPSDRYSILHPEFIMERHEEPGSPTEYSCKLQLPCNAPFEKLEGPPCRSMRLAQQAVCLAACKKLHEMGAFTDMLLPDKGIGEEAEKVEQNDEGDPLPGTARHREFYPEGVADILRDMSTPFLCRENGYCLGKAVMTPSCFIFTCTLSNVKMLASPKIPLTQVSEFAILFGNELDAEVLSMSMDLFIARSVLTLLKSFHVRLMSIVLDVDVEPSNTPWDTAKAYLFVPLAGGKSADPMNNIDWFLVENVTETDVWSNPLQRARPDVYLGTNERSLGGDRREYGFGKLRHGMAFEQKSHPTYGIRGAVAQFDVVKASGLAPKRDAGEVPYQVDITKGKLMLADSCIEAENLVGRIITAAHSGKRFYVDSVRFDMTADNSFPRKEGYLGPLEYSSYADYYKQKYGVDLRYKQQPLIRARGVSYCKNLLSPRFEHSEDLEALTAASCQETFCYERAELLGDAYLKWVVSRFLFLKHPQKHEGQLTRMRQKMVSNSVLYEYALNKGLQSYIQADRFAPSRWAAPGVLPVFDEDTKEEESSFFDQEVESDEGLKRKIHDDEEYEEYEMEDGELESDSSSYRVLSGKTLADVVEALIGVYYVEGGKNSANHLMKWIGIEIDFDLKEINYSIKPSTVPDNILRTIDFDALEVLDHLITRHLFFTYTDLPPGRLTDLRAAAVNNENFARVAVKHNLHLHLRHGSSALEKQIRDFVKEVQNELSKPGFNSFGLGDCKAPKVLGDIVESIAGAIFLDSGCNTAAVWKVFQPLLNPMVTPETLPMHPVRELQERCQQQAEGLEYKASRNGNLATVEVYVDGVQVGVAHNPQKKMAQKLAARNALVALKEKENAEAKVNVDDDGKEKKNGSQTFTRQTLNDICLRRNWPMPLYKCVHEGGPAHAKRFTFAVRVNTSDRGWTDECIGEPMPSVKKAKDSAAVLLLELLNK
ncbi:Endoribonuclease Dicer1, partial [Sesamum angolense]